MLSLSELVPFNPFAFKILHCQNTSHLGTSVRMEETLYLHKLCFQTQSCTNVKDILNNFTNLKDCLSSSQGGHCFLLPL